MDAIPTLAAAAADRISAGALNGRPVSDLAAEFGVSERHLRRAIERSTGVSPLALAQTHRLLLAKQLLMDTSLSVTQIAYASGFQSLRRFNSVFRERYRLSPTALRRTRDAATSAPRPTDLVRLTLAYRPPLAWGSLLAHLATSILPGVEVVRDGYYARTVHLRRRTGVVLVRNARGAKPHLDVDVSASLMPALMPLLARLRRLFDLDAEPTVVDSHLAQEGLAELIAERPGLRVPGAFDGFEVALAVLLRTAPAELARRIVAELGEPLACTIAGLTHLPPRAVRVVQAGPDRLRALGLAPALTLTIDRLARAIGEGALRLQSGMDPLVCREMLIGVVGIDEPLATTIAMRALRWPDAFPASAVPLHPARAESYRPWRAYAALHLGTAEFGTSSLPSI